MHSARVDIAMRSWLAAALTSVNVAAQDSSAPSAAYPGAQPTPDAQAAPQPGAAPAPATAQYPPAPSAAYPAAQPTAQPAPQPRAAPAPAAAPAAGAELSEPMLGPYVRPPPVDQAPSRVDLPPQRADPRYRHDGFYFRYAAGLGLGRDIVDVTGADYEFAGGSPTHNSMSAWAGATEVAIGGTPMPGLVLGGGVYTMIMTSSEAKIRRAPSAYAFAPSQLALFSAVVDYYFWEREGLHAQAGLGLASFVMGQGRPTVQPRDVPVRSVRAHTATGFGIVLGVGYEWWIAEQWGIGGLVRMLRGWTSGVDPTGVQWDHDSIAYSLLMTATYH
jgi:hypothetical protein